jgi:ATP-dependent 26S proteasome regulatory subunit
MRRDADFTLPILVHAPGTAECPEIISIERQREIKRYGPPGIGKTLSAIR